MVTAAELPLDGTFRFELLRVGSDNSTRFTVRDVGAGKVAGTAPTPYPTIVLR